MTSALIHEQAFCDIRSRRLDARREDPLAGSGGSVRVRLKILEDLRTTLLGPGRHPVMRVFDPFA